MLTVLIILLLVLILFGSSWLPRLARILGRSFADARRGAPTSADAPPPADEHVGGAVYTQAKREAPGGYRPVVAEILPPDRHDKTDRGGPSGGHRV